MPLGWQLHPVTDDLLELELELSGLLELELGGFMQYHLIGAEELWLLELRLLLEPQLATHSDSDGNIGLSCVHPCATSEFTSS